MGKYFSLYRGFAFDRRLYTTLSGTQQLVHERQKKMIQNEYLLKSGLQNMLSVIVAVIDIDYIFPFVLRVSLSLLK